MTDSKFNELALTVKKRIQDKEPFLEVVHAVLDEIGIPKRELLRSSENSKRGLFISQFSQLM